MFEELKYIAKEVSYKEKIDLRLKLIKDVFDWSYFEVDDICRNIDVTGLYKFNQIHENINWKNIAKLSINLYIDYDYFKDFIFLNKHKGQGYDYRLRMLGYIEENGYWTSIKRPEKEIVIENVFISCLYQLISKRLSDEQQRNDDKFDTVDAINAIRISSNVLNMTTCPFCDYEPVIKEQGCCQCGATNEDITSFIPLSKESVDNCAETRSIALPVKEAIRTQLVETISSGTCKDNDKLIFTCQPNVVTQLRDQKETRMIHNDPVNLATGVNLISYEPITSTIQDLIINDKFGNTPENNEKKKIVFNDEQTKDHFNKKRKCDSKCDSPNFEMHIANITTNSQVAAQSDDIKQVLEVNSDSKWQCESCGLLNEQSFVSCEACCTPKVAMWTCLYCMLDNKISTAKCVGCDREIKSAVQRIFCINCRDNEVVAENEICEECLMIKWVCWRTSCHGLNYGTAQYCSHCGIDKAADIRPGQSIKVLKDDMINFIWICLQCDNTNDDNGRDRCGKCQGPRYRTGTPVVSVSDGICIDSSLNLIIDGEQLAPSPSDQFHPSLCQLEPKQLWECHYCHVDNVISSSQCVACGKTRFCKQCKVHESINEDLCADCLAQRWRCWYESCKNINLGTYTLYCEKCGLSQQAPNVRGEPVWQKIHDRSQLVWLCDTCQKINDNCQNICSNYHCRTPRNKKFIWCKRCGWGTSSGLLDSVWLRKCKHCNSYL